MQNSMQWHAPAPQAPAAASAAGPKIITPAEALAHLEAKVRPMLKSNQLAQFQSQCSQYSLKKTSARDFYQQLLNLFSQSQIEEFFPDLLLSVPNQDRVAQLQQAHEAAKRAPNRSVDLLAKNKKRAEHSDQFGGGWAKPKGPSHGSSQSSASAGAAANFPSLPRSDPITNAPMGISAAPITQWDTLMASGRLNSGITLGPKKNQQKKGGKKKKPADSLFYNA